MPKLSVILPDDLALYVAEEVQTGHYRDASDLVTEGLRRLQQVGGTDPAKLGELKRAIDEGLADHREGRYGSKSIKEIADAVLAERPIAS